MRDFFRHWWRSARIGADLFIPPWRSLPQNIGCLRVSAPVWLVDRLIQGPLFGLYQAWMCRVWHRDEDGPRWWAYYPGHCAYLLFDRVAGWVERHGVAYRWNAPDSGIPGEVGFHSLSDGSHERDPVRVFVQCSGDGVSTITYSDSVGVACTTTWTTPDDDTPWSYTTA